MKTPRWWQRSVDATADNVTIRLTRKQAYVWLGTLGVFLIVALVCIGWGVSRQVSLVQLQQQNELQQEQLKLLQSKTNALEVKMKAVDQLDAEIRKMVSGSEAGKMPAGGGTDQDVKKAKTAESEEPHPVKGPVPVAQLSAQLSTLDRQVQRRLASLYLLRSVLQEGAGSAIQKLQGIAFAANGPDANSHTPSIWPVKGVITSPFGARVDPVNGGSGFHEGIDIANEYGTPVVATAAGVVSFAGDAGGYGYMVEIDHGNGFVTRYAHASTLLVKQGDTVVQGQPVILMGSTGKSTGVHTHYEVRIHGTPVDPMLFLPIS